MKLAFILLLGFLSSASFSQTSNTKASPWNETHNVPGYAEPGIHAQPLPQGIPIPISGTVPIGLEGMYQGQFANRGLHNIIIDPDHPKNLHAAVQFAENVTEADTIPGKDFLPQLQVYYFFSSDDGMTWSQPKAIDTAKTQNHEMILMKRGSEYVPVIAAVRNNADTNAPYFCSLYIEQGPAGAGDFKEFRTDRKTFRDSLRNLDYPSIALSNDGTKIFMTAGIDNTNAKNPGYIQFGTFTLSEDGKTATWGGWKQGPNAGQSDVQDPVGFAFPWSISVRIAASGKIGITWANRDYGTPDLSNYLSESTDEGVTWQGTPKSVFTPLDTQQPSSPDGDPYLLVAPYTDFWYSGEHAQCAMTGYYYNRDTGKATPGYYIPQSGSLLYWNDTMSQAELVLSKENDTPLGSSLLDGSFLSAWGNAAGSPDPQGLTNLIYPTVARTSNPNTFSIYFNAWQDGDVEDVSNLGSLSDPNFTSLPYFGIWRITTINGGVTFSDPEMIQGNDLSNLNAQTYDYRQIETAPWNPSNGSVMNVHTIFNVDTIAGIMNYSGYPGFDDVTWLYQESIPDAVSDHAGSLALQIINYPNPFSAKTTIPFTLTGASYVMLTVSDELGRDFVHQRYGMLTTGEQTVSFDAGKLHTGSYPYVLEMGDKVSRGVFTVVK